ncbi:MAG: ROK family protein [Nitrososphaerota archaeon]
MDSVDSVDRVWGGIEGGGTKFRCILGRGMHADEIVAEQTIPTTTPAETLGAVGDFFARYLHQQPQRRHRRKMTLAGLGIACFGPIDLVPTSPRFGSITSTPKPGWSHVDVVGVLRSHLRLPGSVPVAWETDVNGALIAEQRWGAAQGLASAVYFTVGTGVGGGALVEGHPLHGLIHPEMGHIPVSVPVALPEPRSPTINPASAAASGPDAPSQGTPHVMRPAPAGVCPFHDGRCLEGVASGPALAQRAGRPAATIPPDDPLWEEEAYYLASAAVVATLLLSPQRIIFGGGVVLHQPHLLPRIRAQFLAQLNGYVRHPTITDHVATYVVAPQLGNRAGVLGALALAMDASGAAPAPG